MDYKKSKILTYLGLTMLLLFSFKDLPMLGVSLIIDPFALFIIIIIIAAIIISYNFTFSQGNIKEFEISKFKLIWSDKIEKKFNTNKMLRDIKISGPILFLSILIVLSVILAKKFDADPTSGAIIGTDWIFISIFVISLIGIIFSSMYFFMGLATYVWTRKLATLDFNIYLYKEGIKYLNYFIKIDDVKSINYPKSFEASKKTSKFLLPFVLLNPLKWGAGTTGTVLGAVSSGTTLKIMDINDKVYFVEIIDKQGFEQALIRLNKQNLIK